MKRTRLVFCTTPCVYSSVVLSALIESPYIEVVAIISSTRNLRIKESFWASDFKRIVQSGFRYSCYLWLITQGHSLFSSCSRIPSIQTLASNNKIPNYKTKNINSDEMKAILSQLGPDILLCAHFNQRIATDIFSLAKESALNIHPSLLPDLKGVDPSFYALLENYQTTGVSLHYMDEAFDTGTVIAKRQYRIQRTDSLFALNHQLFSAGVTLFIDYVSNGNKDYSTEESSKSRYDSWPSTSQVGIFRRNRKLLSFQDIKWLFQKK